MKGMKKKRITEVLEEVEVLVEKHFFNEFFETKSSLFLKKVVSNQGWKEIRLFKKTWRSLNCTPKTLRIVREIQENILCVGKRNELISKRKRDSSACAARLGCH